MMNVMARNPEEQPEQQPAPKPRPRMGPDPMKSERRSGPRPLESKELRERLGLTERSTR
jgi:hypothetical protein